MPNSIYIVENILKKLSPAYPESRAELFQFILRLQLFLIFLPSLLFAQTDWYRWGKSETSYQLQSSFDDGHHSISSNSITDIAVSSLTNVYWIFFSDVDGDNCAFSPTCSSFFIESVKETNLFQGILMFADRLTRDTDFIGRESRYPQAKNGRYYDMPFNYKLNPVEIKYIPHLSSINDE